MKSMNYKWWLLTTYIHWEPILQVVPTKCLYQRFGWEVVSEWGVFGANSEVLAQALQSNPQMPGGHWVVVGRFRWGNPRGDFREEMKDPTLPKTDILLMDKILHHQSWWLSHYL